MMLWGVDVSDCDDGLGKELGKRSLCFVELRTLMVATDWTDVSVMQQLAVAGQELEVFKTEKKVKSKVDVMAREHVKKMMREMKSSN